MQKNNIQIVAYQEIKLSEKFPVKSPACYFIIQENRPKERGERGGVAFKDIKHKILFQEIKLKTSGKHLEVQAI